MVNGFTVSDEVSTVAVYFLELEFIELGLRMRI